MMYCVFLILSFLVLSANAASVPWPAALHNPFAINTKVEQKRQLLLKARIVSVDTTFVHQLGVLFHSSDIKNLSSEALGTISLPIAKLGSGRLLDAQLNALEKSGHANIISSPELVTLDNKTASIEAGDEVPYQQETANGGTSVAFKNALLKLQVTPHILSATQIDLDLAVNQDKVSALTVQGVPAIHTQRLATQVQLKDRQTFVLGGIYETTQSQQRQGIPVLKDIPLLGYAFRHHKNQIEHRELLIFITVMIL